jgi:hypothetical protein
VIRLIDAAHMLKSFIFMVSPALKRRFAELLLKKESSDSKRSVHHGYDPRPEPSGLTTLISVLPSRCSRDYTRSGLMKDTSYLPGLRILGLLDVETKAIMLRIWSLNSRARVSDLWSGSLSRLGLNAGWFSGENNGERSHLHFMYNMSVLPIASQP